MRILLVENNLVDKRAIARVIASIPTSVDLYWEEDGAPALELLIGEQCIDTPLIVLLDLHLEEVHGQDVLDVLGDLRDHPRLRLFVFTASEDKDDRHGTEKHHPTGYIAKQSVDEDGEALRDLLRDAWLDLEGWQ